MLGVTVACVGSIGEKFYADACAEYQKRLGAFCNLTVREVAEQRLPRDPSPAEISAALGKEATRLAIDRKSLIIPLCVEGAQLTSEQFADKIASWQLEGQSRLTFVIGGSFGLAPEVKALGGFKLSLSKMTLPHHLARVFLLEQLYRAFSINSGGKYHK